MKKRRIIVVIAVVLAVLALVPIPVGYKDGGSVEYKALLYSVTKRHSITSQEVGGGYVGGYDIGTIVKILGFKVYDDVEFVSDETA